MVKLKDSVIRANELQQHIVDAITEGAFAFRYIANYADDNDKQYFIDKSDALLAVAEKVANRI